MECCLFVAVLVGDRQLGFFICCDRDRAVFADRVIQRIAVQGAVFLSHLVVTRRHALQRDLVLAFGNLCSNVGIGQQKLCFFLVLRQSSVCCDILAECGCSVFVRDDFLDIEFQCALVLFLRDRAFHHLRNLQVARLSGVLVRQRDGLLIAVLQGNNSVIGDLVLQLVAVKISIDFFDNIFADCDVLKCLRILAVFALFEAVRFHIQLHDCFLRLVGQRSVCLHILECAVFQHLLDRESELALVFCLVHNARHLLGDYELCFLVAVVVGDRQGVFVISLDCDIAVSFDLILERISVNILALFRDYIVAGRNILQRDDILALCCLFAVCKRQLGFVLVLSQCTVDLDILAVFACFLDQECQRTFVLFLRNRAVDDLRDLQVGLLSGVLIGDCNSLFAAVCQLNLAVLADCVLQLVAVKCVVLFRYCILADRNVFQRDRVLAVGSLFGDCGVVQQQLRCILIFRQCSVCRNVLAEFFCSVFLLDDLLYIEFQLAFVLFLRHIARHLLCDVECCLFFLHLSICNCQRILTVIIVSCILGICCQCFEVICDSLSVIVCRSRGCFQNLAILDLELDCGIKDRIVLFTEHKVGTGLFQRIDAVAQTNDLKVRRTGFPCDRIRFLTDRGICHLTFHLDLGQVDIALGLLQNQRCTLNSALISDILLIDFDSLCLSICNNQFLSVPAD